MAKVDDNVFPKVILGVGTAPAAPSDSSWKLYSQANGVYAKSSNTTVGPLGTGGSVGTGNAGAVYAMGNGSAIWNGGTSFPGSKATGDRYWRSDLSLEFYWDGSRWLTTTEYCLGMSAVVDALQPLSANGQLAWSTTDMSQGGMWITRLAANTYVGATNDGTKYWTLQLNSYSPALAAHAVGSSYNTSADTQDAYTKHTVTIGAAVTAGDQQLRLSATKTSTPGTLYGQAAVWYRLIGS